MNSAHWHLLLNHLPVIGSVIGTLILVAGYLLKSTTAVRRTALGVFVFAAVTAVPAYLTGEGAEEVTEKLAGVTERGIENHEDISVTFLVMAGILGVLALLTFVADLKKWNPVSYLYAMVFVTALVTNVFAKKVATSGGEIRHTEIRDANSQAPASADAENEQQEEDH